MIKHTISVVIPAKNEERTIEKTLESLKNQTYEGNIEIIVVDNNSTDKTASIASKLGAKVVTEKTPGVAIARQTGCMSAQGSIIAMTDADTRLPLNWIESIVDAFEQNPKIVAVGGLQSFYDAKPLLSFLMDLANNTLLHAPKWFLGNNLAVKSDAFRKIGGFNIHIPVFEDQEICERLKKLGIVKKLPNLVVMVSARRYNELGLISGIWYYNKIYLKWRLRKIFNFQEAAFTSGSEIKSGK